MNYVMTNELCSEEVQAPIDINKHKDDEPMTSKLEDASDDFGHSDCGEPLLTQNIVLDFTPNEDDNDYIQMKCCAFWEFVNNQPELESLVTLPEVEKVVQVSESGDYITICDEAGSCLAIRKKEKTAVSMLELVEEKGLIDRAFESKLPKSHCSLGFMDYVDYTSINNAKGEDTDMKRLKNNKQQDNEMPPTSSTVRAMCEQLQEWDLKHPKCRPICKSRRRVWKGEIQNTSAELALERKSLHECFKRWPTKVYANGPCPLFAKTNQVTVVDRNTTRTPNIVRICQAPIDDTVHTPYLNFVRLAKALGALDAVNAHCAFCSCNGCCVCGPYDYVPADEYRDKRRRHDMRDFDTRVKYNYHTMRIMYDKI